MDIEKILDKLDSPQGLRNALLVLVALNLFAFSALLFMGANGVGPVYEVLKPTAEDEYYILNSQTVGDITVDGAEYTNILLFNVTPLDSGLNKARGEEILYFAKENMLRNDLEDGEIIICTWVTQVTGGSRIINVISYEDYNTIKESGINFLQ